MYSREFIIQATREGYCLTETFVNALGQASGGGTPSVLRERIRFWQDALALEGADAVSDRVRAFAEEQITLNERLLEPPKPVNRYGPPPDYKGQPV